MVINRILLGRFHATSFQELIVDHKGTVNLAFLRLERRPAVPPVLGACMLCAARPGATKEAGRA